MPEDCRAFADGDAITLMIQRKKEKAIPVKDRVYCPNPCCSFLMSDLDLIRHIRNNNPRQSEARKCMECGLSFCKKCHVPWHYKKTCDEFKKSESYLKSEAALLESFVKTQGWKKCSQCQSIVEHGGGCKQMTCRYWTFVIEPGFILFVQNLTLIICLLFLADIANTSSVTHVGLRVKRRN